ncbi:MAG: hypothetical protein ABIR84_11790, partial [Candidatus Nitrotoga sp.]
MNLLRLTVLLSFVTIFSACSTTENTQEVSGVSNEFQKEKKIKTIRQEIETVTTTKTIDIENIDDQDLEVHKATAKTIESYQKEAAQGDANAQYALGIKYRNGEGVAQDYAKAREWF